MSRRDIYNITREEVLLLIEANGCRFRVLLDKKKRILEQDYIEVPSWLRFQVEMKARGKAEMLAQIEDIDGMFLLDEMQNQVMEALQSNDTERLRALQTAMATLVNREKLATGGEEGETAPIAMTVNVSGLGGKKENK